ncbi:centromere protein F [Sphaeramia orbicularis]|uniref:centromere protein F n=1 Tax=Sphaeramia orbicularis TaxID=375764 RepID=UPI00117F5AFC|nr:centromere protein F-like [Sphaeramia orbicularis]
MTLSQQPGDDPQSLPRRHMLMPSCHSQSEQEDCGKPKDARTQEMDKSLLELQRKLSVLEEELHVKSDTLKSLQNEVAQSKKELSAREVNLQRARDELSMAHTRIAKESERASGAEQRLKQLQEELKCQRQNSESSRLQHQQRTKELEKQHQRDLLELQKERQHLEKQHQQEVNKLNQELSQARTLYNALQAQADKVSLQKQALDKELETLREKLKWTEGQLQQSQKKETQTQAKLMEALREAEGVAVSLEQSRKNERALEEEGRRLAEERDDALRLLKDLQEQKAVPEPQQAVQFCPVGQSFSAQMSISHQQQPSNQTRRPNTTNRPKQRREEEEEEYDERRAVSYPTDREPGEGIDSEHIATILSKESDCLQREGPRRKTNEAKHRSGNEVMEIDSSETNRHYTCEQVLSTQTSTSMGVDNCTLMPPADQTSLPEPEPTKDLLTENATLRSELCDVREELQKRLEDLETQRRAEAEARTRLKQLSRKNATQSVEKEEQYKECKAQLEREKAETERLKKSLNALETEMKKGREERNKGEQKDETNKDPQDREEEMIELNIQLKKQLVEVKAQLALEREERKQEEKIKATKTDIDLNKKLAELLAEIEELKSRKEDSMEEEKLSLANSPLTYLTLHEDELNSNIVDCDNQLLPLPKQHLVFCQSTNQHNTLVSQSTAGFIQEDGTQIDDGHPHLLNDKQLEQQDLDQEDDTPQNYLRKGSDQRQEHFDLQKDASASSELAKEVEHLQRENARETERADQCQVKLQALQSQVTQQTQHLTMAFEKQSLHISGLLAELQEKESTLLRKQEELQLCKQELDALKSEKHREDRTKTEAVYNTKQEVKNRERTRMRSALSLPPLQAWPLMVNLMLIDHLMLKHQGFLTAAKAIIMGL